MHEKMTIRDEKSNFMTDDCQTFSKMKMLLSPTTKKSKTDMKMAKKIDVSSSPNIRHIEKRRVTTVDNGVKVIQKTKRTNSTLKDLSNSIRSSFNSMFRKNSSIKINPTMPISQLQGDFNRETSPTNTKSSSQIYIIQKATAE
jgi:hypothetical protein